MTPTATPRPALRSSVLGKRHAEVKALLGSPARTGEESSGWTWWSYYRLTYDPAAGVVDDMTTLEFDEKGVVRKVLFNR